LAAIIRRREAEEFLERRAVAAWPWTEAHERSKVCNAIQQELAELDGPLPAADTQFEDEAMREHVRQKLTEAKARGQAQKSNT